MNRMSCKRRRTAGRPSGWGRRLAGLILLLAGVGTTHPAWSAGPADSPAVGAPLDFGPATAKAKAFFLRQPVTRDLASEDFEMAGVDLDGDGRKEVVLRSTAASYCGSAGCAVQVLQQRGQRVVELLSLFTSARLAVTRDPVGGAYRALAIVNDQGQVVRADKPGTPMHGKLMVYPMGWGR